MVKTRSGEQDTKTSVVDDRTAVRKKKVRSTDSTVPGYTIPEIRRCLDKIRKAWADRANNEFSLDTRVSEKDTIMSFSLRFMMGHHRKRHARRARKQS